MSAALFAVPGISLVAKAPHFVNEMARLGYPGYFLAPFGALKILAAAVILAPRLPRLKEWAYAGMMFDAGFAMFSRSAVGDGALLSGLPAVIGAVALVSWWLRPQDRRLPQSPPTDGEV